MPEFVVLDRPPSLSGCKLVIVGDDIKSVSVAGAAVAKFKRSLLKVRAESKLPRVVIDGPKSSVGKCKLWIKVDRELVTGNRRRRVPVEAFLLT